MKYLSPNMLFLCLLLEAVVQIPISGFAQKEVLPLNYSIAGREPTTEYIELQFAVAYPQKGTRKNVIRDLDPRLKVVSVFLADPSNEKAEVRVVLKNTNLAGRKIKIEYTTSGAFGVVDSKRREIDFDSQGSASKDFLALPIQNAGIGYLQITVLELPGSEITLNPDSRSENILFPVQTLEHQARRSTTIEEHAKLIDQFGFFKDGDFDRFVLIDQARNDLRDLEQKLAAAEEDLRRKAANENEPWNSTFQYFRTFGTPKYNCLRSFKSKADDLIARAEMTAWRGAKAGNEIGAIEDFQKRFCDNIPGYTCSITKNNIDDAVKAIINNWITSGDFCDRLSEITSNAYYKRHKNESPIREAEKKCSEAPPDPEAECKQLRNAAQKRNNLAAVRGFYEKAQEKNCDDGKYLREIRARLDYLSCAEKFDRFKQETSVEVKVGLLQEIADDGTCLNFRDSAEHYLKLYDTPKLELVTERLTPIIDPINKNTYYRYKVLDRSNAEVKVVGIDQSRSLEEITHLVAVERHDEADPKFFEFKVYDYRKGGSHMIYFATELGMQDTIELPIHMFNLVEAKLLDEHQLFISVEYGKPPYWVEFVDDNSSIYHKLGKLQDTLDLSTMAHTNAGVYAARIHDSNGSTFDLPFEVTLSSGKSPLRLWAYLGGPTLLMIFFLFYRNRPK